MEILGKTWWNYWIKLRRRSRERKLKQEMNEATGIYIHVPFCRAKCYYCDFNSYPDKDNLIAAYFKAMETELEFYGNKFKSRVIDTIFIGGGTPSYPDEKYIIQVLDVCRRNFNLSDNAEITIESNPGTLSREKIRAYRQSGINRLSIGLQAWQDRLLKKMGRIHTVEEYINNFAMAREEGFENISTDLIFAIPGQTLEDWCETLENVVAMGPEHISCYSLQIEEGTLFGKLYSEGRLTPVEDELDREMYYRAKEILGNAGYKHYEISNFARPGYQCRHNLIYWQTAQYIGIGAGAHSYIEGKRFNNVYSPEEYINLTQLGKSTVENVISIDKEGAMSEYMILGLRLIDGINSKDFERRFDEDLWKVFGEQLEKLAVRGLIVIEPAACQENGENVRLTDKGLDLANQVFMEMLR